MDDTFRVSQFWNEGEELSSFSMRKVVVDEIPSSVFNDQTDVSITVQPMFDLKRDWYDIAPEDDEGYVDDRTYGVAWSGAYIPVPQKDGEMNEHAWLKHGYLCGVDDPYLDSCGRWKD